MTLGQEDLWEIVAHIGTGDVPRDIPGGVLRRGPLLAPEESILAMSSCDVLLLFMPPGEREPSPTVPLKAYSYLRTGLPLVYCGEAGATTDLLAQFPGTFALPRCGGAELADFLAQHAGDWGRRYPRGGIERYSFEQLGRGLEGLLGSLLDDHASEGG